MLTLWVAHSLKLTPPLGTIVKTSIPTGKDASFHHLYAMKCNTQITSKVRNRGRKEDQEQGKNCNQHYLESHWTQRSCNQNTNNIVKIFTFLYYIWYNAVPARLAPEAGCQILPFPDYVPGSTSFASGFSFPMKARGRGRTEVEASRLTEVGALPICCLRQLSELASWIAWSWIMQPA